MGAYPGGGGEGGEGPGGAILGSRCAVCKARGGSFCGVAVGRIESQVECKLAVESEPTARLLQRGRGARGGLSASLSIGPNLYPGLLGCQS